MAVHAVWQALHGRPLYSLGHPHLREYLSARQGQTGILVPALLSSQNWDMQRCATEGCSHKAEGGAC